MASLPARYCFLSDEPFQTQVFATNSICRSDITYSRIKVHLEEPSAHNCMYLLLVDESFSNNCIES